MQARMSAKAQGQEAATVFRLLELTMWVGLLIFCLRACT